MPGWIMSGQDSSQNNGILQSSSNGTTTASSEIKTEGPVQDGKTATNMDQLPPALTHITTNFQPLSRLLERSAQECYNNLDETITSLADIPSQIDEKVLAHPENFKNIVVSSSDAQKRLKWLEFGKTQRERFVKLLVLTRWSRQVDDVGKVIDLVNWMNTQSNTFGEVDESMAQLRRWLDGEKMPAPDLETALEVLATGNSTKMPDFGFIKPQPLTAVEILDTFRNINTILHLRLNTTENLPHHLRNFRIASGRVTFTIPNEFELDLSLVDEDPASQFYFIDFRFLFSPTSEIPAGSVQDFEARANNALATEGLSGCYNLFHDFVLTHKINILRRQAVNLNRTSWAGSLNIEQVHRSLIIQYWKTKPKPKSWIEIGIASNRSARSSSSSPSLYVAQHQSGLRVKWICTGEEVRDFSLNLDDSELNCKYILEHIMVEHSEHLLGAISDALPQTYLIYGPLDGVLNDVPSLQFPVPTLVIPLLHDQVATMFIEPTTGDFSIYPVTQASLRCQDELNALPNPWVDAAKVLKSRMPSMMLLSLADSALSFDWELVISPKNERYAKSVKTWLADVHSCAFRPRKWAFCSWVIGFTVDSSRTFEWSVFEETAESLSPDPIWFIPDILFRAHTAESFPFQRVDFISWAFIFDRTVWTYLRNSKTPCTFPARSLTAGEQISKLPALDRPKLGTFSVNTAALLKDRNAAQCLEGSNVDLWLSSIRGRQSHINPLALRGILKNVQQHASEFARMDTSQHIEWHPGGAFVLRTFDASISSGPDYAAAIDMLIPDTLWLCRLPVWLSTLKQRGFLCTAMSMQSISFKYRYGSKNGYQSATCTINNLWGSSKLKNVSKDPIELDCPEHQLLVLPFKWMLEGAGYSQTMMQGCHTAQIMAFDEITKALIYAIPLVTALDKLTRKTNGGVNLQICPRAWSTTLLRYRASDNRECVLRVCLRQNFHTGPVSGKAIAGSVEHVDAEGTPGGMHLDQVLRNDISQYLATGIDQDKANVPKLHHGISFDPDDFETILDAVDSAVRAAVLRMPPVVKRKEEPVDTTVVDVKADERASAETTTLERPVKRQRSDSGAAQLAAPLMARGVSEQNPAFANAKAQTMARAQSSQGQGAAPGKRPLNLAQPQAQAQLQPQLQPQLQVPAQAQAQVQTQAKKPQKQPPPKSNQGQAQQAQAAGQNKQGVASHNMANGVGKPTNGGAVEVVEID